MTENVENLVLEHLRHIRARVDQIAEDVNLVKHRLTSLESQAANIHSDMAIIHLRIDQVDQRMNRIERRLDLVDDVH